MHILFVCTGNICRSPTAERLAAALGADNAIPDFRASSAGTRAVIGHPMHGDAARVLERLGGDPAGFSARQLTPKIAADADLVLSMTKAQRDAVLQLAPRQLHRTFSLTEAAALITEFAPAQLQQLVALRPRLDPVHAPDVPDPIGEDPQFFDWVGSQIAQVVRTIVNFCSSTRPPETNHQQSRCDRR